MTFTQTPADPGPQADMPPRSPSTSGWCRDRLLWLVMSLLALPLVVVAGVVATRSWFPTSDWALIEAKTRDVGTSSTPLLGPFSRYGWNHPGPVMFWILAPAYRLAGQQAAGLMVGAALMNAAVLVGGAAVARRVGGRSLLLAFGAVAAVFTHAAAHLLIDPWNPYIALAPFAVLILASWGLATGVWWLAPVIVAMGSFTIQSHVGYGLLVPPLVLWALAASAGKARRAWSDNRKQLATALLASAGVGLVMWLAPLGQQVATSPGNMSEIVSYFTSPSDELPAGWRIAGDAVSRSLAPFAPWLGFEEPIDLNTPQLAATSVVWALPVLVLLGITAIAAVMRRDRVGVLGAGTLAVVMVMGVVAVSRINGVAYFYIVRWWWVLGMLAWMMVGWLGWRMLAGRITPSVRKAVMVVAVTIMVTFGVATVAGARNLPNPGPQGESAALAEIGDDVVAALPATPDGEGYLVIAKGFSLFETFLGLVNHLDAAGVNVVTEADFKAQFGESRTIGGRGAVTPNAGTIVMVTGEYFIEADQDPSWQLIAAYDPLTASQRSELSRLQNQLFDRLMADGRTEQASWVWDRRVLDLVRNDPMGLTADELETINVFDDIGDRQRVFLKLADTHTQP